MLTYLPGSPACTTQNWYACLQGSPALPPSCTRCLQSSLALAYYFVGKGLQSVSMLWPQLGSSQFCISFQPFLSEATCCLIPPLFWLVIKAPTSLTALINRYHQNNSQLTWSPTCDVFACFGCNATVAKQNKRIVKFAWTAEELPQIAGGFIHCFFATYSQ